jgi:transposase
VTADEIAKMKKQMLRLQEENEILKKAMAIFAKK